MIQAKPINQAKRVTLIGAGVNLLLALFKLIIGSLSNSHALIADGVHSLSDLLTDFLVLVTAHYGQQEADEDHPYGHHRIETVGTIALAGVLVIVALGIMYDAIMHLLVTGVVTKPGIAALVMAAISVVVNEWLFHITKRVGQRIHSAMLIANAWHHRSDAASSLVVVIGLLGTLIGWLFLDVVAAVIVAMLILHMGSKLMWSGLRELIDTSVEPETLDHIRELIVKVPGVTECHQLRTRSMGGKIIVDVHVTVDGKVSVSEGHRIGEQVEKKLHQQVPSMHDVMVHIDPEDDEDSALCHHLPFRDKIEKKIQAALSAWPQGAKIDRYVIHYLSGKMFIELNIAMNEFADLQQMRDFQTQVVRAVQALENVAEVQLYFY